MKTRPPRPRWYPLDPFDGKPLRMVRRKNGDVTLYSVGQDAKNDGGTEIRCVNSERLGDLIFRLPARK